MSNDHPNSKLSNDFAESLDMNHFHICFTDYLWAKVALGVPLLINTVLGGPLSTGYAYVKLREVLQRWGLVSATPPHDPRRVVAEMLLETSSAVYFTKVYKDEKGNTVAHFEVPRSGYIEGDEVRVGLLSILINVRERAMVSATLDGQDLAPEDAVWRVMMVAMFISHTHVHTFANWAVNMETSDPFLRLMGVITATYNHFGRHGAVEAVEMLHKLGLFKTIDGALTDLLFHNAESQMPPPHAHIIDLMPHSSYVRCMVGMRKKFLQLFVKHQSDFPGVDGEAMFIGTVMHSIDHHKFLSVAHPLDASYTKPEYAANVDVIRLTLASLADKLPVMGYVRAQVQFKYAKHQLFRDCYTHAKRYHPQFADHMECAIIR